MPGLHKLQTAFRRALLEENEDACALLEAEIAGGDLRPSERLAVYRNNVIGSLIDVLRETFPVICRLVDERFFSYVAHEFIVAYPPSRPALFEYGGAFPEFLANFPPCRELVYLRDVARLEWLMNVAATATDAEPVLPAALAEIAPEHAARLSFRFHPAHGYLDSPWPIDRIWRANRDCKNDEHIDLGAGGIRLEISRRDETVVFRSLDEPEFVFRRALFGGAALETALEQALAIRPDFAADSALAALFQEGAIVAVIQPTEGEQTS